MFGSVNLLLKTCEDVVDIHGAVYGVTYTPCVWGSLWRLFCVNKFMYYYLCTMYYYIHSFHMWMIDKKNDGVT